MIIYAQKNALEAANEIQMRINSLGVDVDIDYSSMITLINRAIINIAFITTPYKKWHYINTVAAANGSRLPLDFIAKSKFMANTGGALFIEARYCTIKEYGNFISERKAYYRATLTSPVYTIWGNNDITTQRILLVSPSTITGYFDYYGTPTRVSTVGDRLPIHDDYYNLLINICVSYVLQKHNTLVLYEFAQKAIIAERKKLLAEFMTARNIETKESSDYVLPVPPVVSQTETPQLVANIMSGEQ